MLFFTTGKVEHFVGILDEHGAFGLCLSDVDPTSEDRDLGILDISNNSYKYIS